MNKLVACVMSAAWALLASGADLSNEVDVKHWLRDALTYDDESDTFSTNALSGVAESAALETSAAALPVLMDEATESLRADLEPMQARLAIEAQRPVVMITGAAGLDNALDRENLTMAVVSNEWTVAADGSRHLDCYVFSNKILASPPIVDAALMTDLGTVTNWVRGVWDGYGTRACTVELEHQNAYTNFVIASRTYGETKVLETNVTFTSIVDGWKIAGIVTNMTSNYIQDGLVARWDSMENVGFGRYDSASDFIVDLVSGLQTYAITNTWFWNEGRLSPRSSSAVTLSLSVPSALSVVGESNSMTLEMAGKSSSVTYSAEGAYDNSSGMFLGLFHNGYGTEGTASRYYNFNVIAYSVYNWALFPSQYAEDDGSGTYVVKDIWKSWSIAAGDSYVTPAGTSGGVVSYLYDRKYTFTPRGLYSIKFASRDGVGGGGFDACRVYSRKLTRDEQRHNLELDNYRFNGGPRPDFDLLTVGSVTTNYAPFSVTNVYTKTLTLTNAVLITIDGQQPQVTLRGDKEYFECYRLGFDLPPAESVRLNPWVKIGHPETGFDFGNRQLRINGAMTVTTNDVSEIGEWFTPDGNRVELTPYLDQGLLRFSDLKKEDE